MSAAGGGLPLPSFTNWRAGLMFTHRVFKLGRRSPPVVWVDFEETEVPGGDPQPVSGTNHIKLISAKYLAEGRIVMMINH